MTPEMQTRLPICPGTILVDQKYRFPRPVFVGDTISARAVVAELEQEKGAIRLDVECRNQEQAAVLSSWALARIAR